MHVLYNLKSHMHFFVFRLSMSLINAAQFGGLNTMHYHKILYNLLTRSSAAAITVSSVISLVADSAMYVSVVFSRPVVSPNHNAVSRRNPIALFAIFIEL